MTKPGAPNVPDSMPAIPPEAERPRVADDDPQVVPTVVRPSWKAVADAVGHCVLVFAYAPALLALPRWLWFELGNTANFHEPLILLFAPVRGFLSLLDAFQLGASSGVIMGCLQGLLLSAWRWTHEHTPTQRRRLVLGAASGALAASLTMAIRAFPPMNAGAPPASVRQFALAIASGLVCGILATPSALRLLEPTPEPEATEHAPVCA